MQQENSQKYPSCLQLIPIGRARQAPSETQKWKPPQSEQTAHRGFTLLPKGALDWKKTSLSSLEITNTGQQYRHIVYTVDIAIHYYTLVIFFFFKKKRLFSFHWSPVWTMEAFFSPFRCWSSSRGKSVSTGPKRRKGKQEGVDTLQHQPSSTININLHAPILSTSGRESAISMKQMKPVTA